MSYYDVESFFGEIMNGYPYQALSNLRKHPNLIQQARQSAPNDRIKQIIENMDYILGREDLKRATTKQILETLQSRDIKNVNIGFGIEEDWQQKYLDLQQSYEQLQLMYNSKIVEIEQISDKYAQLEVENFGLREQLELRGQENSQLADQIKGYTDATNQTLENVQEMSRRGNNTISNLQKQIVELKMENEQLRIQINKNERNAKVEEMKRKRHEEAMKNFELSSASKMYDAGVKKTMALLEQFKQEKQANLLRGGAIPMITGIPQNRPMTGGPIPMQRGPIPMPAPSGMRPQNDLREPVLGRQSGPIIEEIENDQRFMIKIGDFSIIFEFNPTFMTPEKIMEDFLPMFDKVYQINGTILVVPNKQQQPVNILNFMQEVDKFRSMFHNWYNNFVGNNYEKIGGQQREVLNLYKYILSEIVKQGKKEEFAHALGYN